MRKFFRKYGKTFAIIIAIGISLMLIVTAVYLLSDYERELKERAESRAQYNTYTLRESVQDWLNDYVTKAVSAATVISEKIASNQELREYLRGIEGTGDGALSTYDVKYARYYLDGVLYDSSGDPSDHEDFVISYREKWNNSAGFAGCYTDKKDAMIMMCFYAPVYNSKLADGLVLHCTRLKLQSLFDNENLKINEDASFRLLCDTSGGIISGDMIDEASLNGETVEVGNFFSIMKSVLGDSTEYREIVGAVNSGEDATVKVNIGTTDYIISIATQQSKMQDLAVAEMYPVNALCASGISVIYTIIAVLILFAVIAVGVVIYLVVHNIIIKKQLFNTETIDPKLNCLNRHGFTKEAEKNLERNGDNYTVFLALQIRHFKFFTETAGETEVKALLNHTKMVLTRMLHQQDLFGYSGNGLFVIMTRPKDREELLEWIKVLTYAIKKYRGVKNVDVQMKYGAYEMEAGENVSVSTMITYSEEANNVITKLEEESAGLPIHFYDNELRKVRMINEDMELRMEKALADGEFQVFYQAKYNLHTDKQDGCEALVRWYNKETKEYQRPALFMALFEANGFVIKLDKYVFTKVCEYLSYTIAHGKRVFPCSVNISRLTALQPEFIDFYSATKRKYGIADNLLTIEFTESFAYENYEELERIVNGLHKNGFLCSVDDFGSGYSSYRILKCLVIDEIKLDRVFMDKGLTDDRDDAIFESIITLAKKLHMKVTQEGVETIDDAKRMKALGCDVLQGYVYSKPLPLSDYLPFTQDSESHKLPL